MADKFDKLRIWPDELGSEYFEFSEKEARILELLSQGKTHKEVAQETGYAVDTLKHKLASSEDRNSLAKKFGVQNIEELKTAYIKAPLRKAIYDQIIYICELELQSIYELTMAGAHLRARQKAYTLKPVIAGLLRKPLPKWFLKELFTLYSKVLIELLKTYDMTETRQTIFSTTKPVLDELEEVARRSSDSEIWGNYNFYSGNVFYILREPGKSSEFTSRATSSLKEVNQLIGTYRINALNWAFLAEPKESEDKIKRATNILDEAPTDLLVEVEVAIYEGLARAYAKNGNYEQTQRILERAKTIYAKTAIEEGRIPIREIMLVKAELEAIILLGLPEEKLIEQLAIQGLTLAKELGGHPRYSQVFNQILKSLDKEKKYF